MAKRELGQYEAIGAGGQSRSAASCTRAIEGRREVLVTFAEYKDAKGYARDEPDGRVSVFISSTVSLLINAKYVRDVPACAEKR